MMTMSSFESIPPEKLQVLLDSIFTAVRFEPGTPGEESDFYLCATPALQTLA